MKEEDGGPVEPSTKNRELELRYSVVDSARARELISGSSLAGLDAGEWQTVDVVDQYLDTNGGTLARAGYGVRLRHADGGTLLTIKSRRRVMKRGRARRRALHDRLELEGKANRRLTPRRWSESAARSLVEASIGDERLRTLFFLDQRREQRDLVRDGDVVARLSLDTAKVRRFGRPLGEFITLEVEAISADDEEARALLDALAETLDQSTSLRPEERSKEEVALRLVDHSLGRGKTGRPPRTPGVVADEQLAEAGRKVLRMHLLRMLLAEPGARLGEDIEAVHKMRVATRRMRAAWRVFDGAYRPRLQRRYVDEIRHVARTLGSVRDIDVQLERLEAYRASLTDTRQAAALDPFFDELRRAREEGRRDLLELFASIEYDHFISDYRSFVETPGAGAVDAPGNRVRDVAAGRIWRAYERVRAHEAMLPFADVPALHALRIDCKRLRYTLEFLRDILPTTVDRLIAEVTATQDHLGNLNDAHIAADITRAWLLESVASLSSAQRAAAGAYLDACEAEVTRLRRTFRPMWRRLSGHTFRRRLALVAGSI